MRDERRYGPEEKLKGTGKADKCGKGLTSITETTVQQATQRGSRSRSPESSCRSSSAIDATLQGSLRTNIKYR